VIGYSFWSVVIVSLVCGVGLGLVAGYLGFPAIKEAKRLRVQLDDALREHETYKTSVSTHFRKTGELVNQMTKSYAAVYDHLAAGARTLGDGVAAESTLPFGPSPDLLASPIIDADAEAEAKPAAPLSSHGVANGEARPVGASSVTPAANGADDELVSSASTSAEVEPDSEPVMATTAAAHSDSEPEAVRA
jgi:uncharacterized membrane-anchored protein YhcB (DUF1043 family)